MTTTTNVSALEPPIRADDPNGIIVIRTIAEALAFIRALPPQSQTEFPWQAARYDLEVALTKPDIFPLASQAMEDAFRHERLLVECEPPSSAGTPTRWNS